MPKINILNILSGDNQSTVVDKINYNFDQILSAGGGPQGQQGLIGSTGPVGPQGVPGIQGAKGDSGNKWFVSSGPVGPTPSSVGDYWLDINTPDQAIYQNVGGVWTPSGYGLSSGDIFQRMTPVKSAGGGINSTAIILGGIATSQTGPKSTSLVLSDAPISPSGIIPGYSPGDMGEVYIRNVNQEDSKLKIATEGRLHLISFSRSELDVTNRNGNGIDNPTISWISSVATGNSAPYDIAFKNPTGGISILTEGGLRGPIEIKSNSDSVFITSSGAGVSGGVNILAQKEITSQSNIDNISIFTAAATKGSFIRFNTDRGFVELNTNTTTDPTLISNSNTPAFFVNATGVGIGVGKNVGFTFKQTGVDPRKLAVLGNVSIGVTPDDHQLIDMFVGIQGNNDYNLGSLYVKGHGAFGQANPRLGGTTGPAEAAGQFPQLFVTTTRNGQAFQAKNSADGSVVSRTTMGDGKWDYNAVSDKTSAGIGPDLTQEFFVSNPAYVFTAAPLISLQHKITNPANVTDTATVFSISTFTIAGTYNAETIADKTLIQTKNSNSNLRIFANATSTANKGNNKVIIGARDKPLIAVFGGTDTDPDRGTVSIGMYAEGNKGLVGPYSTSIISFANNQYNHHALNLRGVQTIGSTEPYSAFALVSPTGDAKYSISTNRDVGTVSMLKVQRLFGQVSSTNYNVGGFRFNNIANGIEIISYKTGLTNIWDANTNKSVAIAVGASANSKTSPTTGFFVSDEGTCVSIGSYIDYGIALNVAGTINSTVSVTTDLLSATTGIFKNGTNATGGTGKGILLWDTGTGASEGLFLDWRAGTNGTYAGIVGYTEASGGGIRFYTTGNNSGSQGSTTTRALRMNIAANGTVTIPGTFSVTNIESTGSINISDPNAALSINTYWGPNLPSDSNNHWRAKQSGNGMWFKIENANANGRLELRTFGNTSAGGAVTSKLPLSINTTTGTMNLLGPIYVGWEQPLSEANGGYAYYSPNNPGYSPNSTQTMNTENFDRHITIYYASGSNGICTLEVQTQPGNPLTSNLAAVGICMNVGCISGVIPAECSWRLRCYNSDHNSYPKATVYLRKFGHM